MKKRCIPWSSDTYRCPGLSTNEDIVREEAEQEGDVGLKKDISSVSKPDSFSADLDTTDTELDESTEHLATSDLVCRAANRALNQQAIIVRLHGNAHLTQMQL